MAKEDPLVSQVVDIVCKVLEELHRKSTSVPTKILYVSDHHEPKAHEVSYLHYDPNECYLRAIIDELSLAECALILHNIEGESKTNFILRYEQKLPFVIKKITGDEPILLDIYKQMLVKRGFCIEDNLLEAKKELSSSNILSKKVISEKYLLDQNIKTNTSLTITKKAIITPLAQDYLRKNHISIIREEENR